MAPKEVRVFEVVKSLCIVRVHPPYKVFRFRGDEAHGSVWGSIFFGPKFSSERGYLNWGVPGLRARGERAQGNSFVHPRLLTLTCVLT